jgi:carbon storage regulator
MLILSRKRNEQIIIGDGVVVTVVSVRRGSVRLGVEAPAGTPVHRREVYQSIQEEPDGAKPAGPAVSPESV